MAGTPGVTPVRRVAHLALCALYVPLAVWVSWPLAAQLGSHVLDVELLHGRFYLLSLADQYLVTWIHTWDAHALATQPAELFHAGIFHPAPWSLARLDHHLGNALLFAPVYLASGNPVLAHNVSVLACYVLSAAAMYFVVWSWLRRTDVAFASGALFAFAPWRLMEGNVQVQLTAYLPLILWLGLRVLRGSGRGSRVALFACLVLQSLCSVYLAAQAFLTFGVALVAGWIARPRRPLGAAVRALVPALGAIAVLAIVHVPYLLLKDVGEIPASSLHMQELVSASPLSSYVRVIDFAGGRYFLSLAAFALASIGAGSGGWLRRNAALPPGCYPALLLLVAIGFALSLGPTLRIAGLAIPLPYRIVTEIPGMGSMRGAFRFGILVTLAASGLAAIGLLRLGSALRPAARWAVAGAALLALLAELSAHAVPLRPMPAEPERADPYRWLASAEPGPVLELPVGDVEKDFRANLWEAQYTYFSSYHWLPLVNGYSSYPPQSYRLLAAIARRLPDPVALRDLVDLAGIRWIVVHGDRLEPWDRPAWQSDRPAAGLRRVARFGEDAIFEVTSRPQRAFDVPFSGVADPSRTITGIARAPLGPEALRASLTDLELGSPLVAGLSTAARVRVENLGSATWPGVDALPSGLVALRDEWIPERGSEVVQRGTSRIARDIAPGEAVAVPFTLVLPRRPGRYRLRLSLVQEGVSDPSQSGDARLEVDVTLVEWPDAGSTR
ncbi:MAG: hypothetical protein JSU66_00480 [Deltaproteobacteria bacterium]|nr:MAG: hypothetical protein JSU66_00480 [Deltaproteobacteria bacterium]